MQKEIKINTNQTKNNLIKGRRLIKKLGLVLY